MSRIRILLNGKPREVPPDSTLADLLAADGQQPQWLATAINGVFVARDARAAHLLREGDAVFTFQPITGG